jgi:succinate-semialdehyde dehydrogenase/glutarate-semialdehyde dehydrogenase
MPYQTINPATGELGDSYPDATADDIRNTLKAAEAAFQKWRTWSLHQRAIPMRELAEVLASRKVGLAELVAREMGKPVAQGKTEVEKCARACQYYASHAETFLQPEQVATEASLSEVRYEPLGIVFAIMPWNFPLWQVFRFAAPTLMAGNAAILKHAPRVPGCALAITEMFHEAGFPDGLFGNLFLTDSQAGQVIRNKLTAAVTLTGSTRAGKAVARQAGAVLKKCVLELGGSDPYVILKDADIEPAVAACVTARMLNGGQSCIAAKRFVVVQKIRAQFEERLVALMDAYTPGDPLDSDTTLGPMARLDLRDALHQQVEASITKGATCLLGGSIPDGPGAFYPPTVLTDVRRGMPAYKEELFGPVAAIVPVRNEKQALRVANDTTYGLGAAVFTQNLERGLEIARHELDAGSAFVNTFVRSDPRLPFGGIKESGYGRELGRPGILEFVNVKTVWSA